MNSTSSQMPVQAMELRELLIFFGIPTLGEGLFWQGYVFLAKHWLSS